MKGMHSPMILRFMRLGQAFLPLDVETELQPTVLLRYGGGLASFDLGLNWVYERFFTVGVFTRELSSFGAILGVKVPGKAELPVFV